jgi:hypothetical protein
MDAERAQKILAEIASKKFTRKEFWNPKAGLNTIRILPSWTGELSQDFFRKTAQHWKLGNNQDLWVTCLLEEGYGRCPVCEKIDHLYKTRNKEDEAFAKLIRKQTKVLYNIVDMNNVSKGVQVWQSGITVLGDIVKFVGNPKYGDVSHPTTGRNLDIIMTEAKESKTGWNDYAVQPDPERSAIAEIEWLEQLQDLDLLVRTKSFEVIEYILERGELPEEGSRTESQAQPKQEYPSDYSRSTEIPKQGTPKQEPKPEPIKAKPEPKEEVTQKSPTQEKDVNDLLAKLRSDRAERVK